MSLLLLQAWLIDWRGYWWWDFCCLCQEIKREFGATTYMSSSIYYLGSVTVNDISLEIGLSSGLFGICVSGVVDPTKLQGSFTETGHWADSRCGSKIAKITCRQQEKHTKKTPTPVCIRKNLSTKLSRLGMFWALNCIYGIICNCMWWMI